MAAISWWTVTRRWLPAPDGSEEFLVPAAGVNMGKFLWALILPWCLLSTSHAHFGGSSFGTVHHDQGGGAKVGTENFHWKLPTTVINKDFLAQEGLLGAIILNNQDLVRERKMPFKILLGSRNLGKDHLLEAAGPLALEGLLCKGSLGGLCGHGSLVGINDVLKTKIPFGKPNSWLKITDFDIARVSCKPHPVSELQLNFQTKLTITFPRILNFLSGSILDVNIGVPFTMLQTKPGHASIAPRNCEPIFNKIHVRASPLSAMVETVLKWMLENSLPNMLCPVVQFWFYIINQQLTIMRNIHSPGLLTDLHSAFSHMPKSPEPYYHLDFQDKYFPASFINWLIERQKMFQLWKLVLLWALLTGTSASLLGTLENDLSNAVDKLKPALEKGPERVEKTPEAVLQKINADIKVLQDPKTWEVLRAKIRRVKSLVDKDISKLVSTLEKSLGLKIGNASILEINGEASADGKGIDFRIPVSAEVTLTLGVCLCPWDWREAVQRGHRRPGLGSRPLSSLLCGLRSQFPNLPLIGNVVHLEASLDILTGVRLETNNQTSLPTVVLEECTSDPASIQLTMLDSTNKLIDRIVETLSRVLDKAVSFLVQDAVCSIIRKSTHTLDVDEIQRLISKSRPGEGGLSLCGGCKGSHAALCPTPPPGRPGQGLGRACHQGPWRSKATHLS
ncbi:uncharacterized protein LOC119515280 [Choloepus didactylus]|uniref:uncharacterized protein LOC119515280 n=1 Tax=Choloepus didactylus TaxID=27675 RepID=UPI0018A03BDA|nr:uncharacterized protein LOC119515280 [Choloepus didactylus]